MQQSLKDADLTPRHAHGVKCPLSCRASCAGFHPGLVSSPNSACVPGTGSRPSPGVQPQSVLDDLVEVLAAVPRPVLPAPVPSQPLFNLRSIFLNPTINRGMIDWHTPFAHHLLKVAVADPIAAIPSYRPQNHFTLKMTPLEIAHQKSRSESSRSFGHQRDFLQQSGRTSPGGTCLSSKAKCYPVLA